MKKVYLGLFFLICAARAFAADDAVNKIATIIRQGKISELTALMAEGVEVSVAGDNNTFSKTQAQGVLTIFFNQHKPLSVKVLHKINSSLQYRFGVLLIETSKGTYRIALTLRQDKGVFQLIEMRIEAEKVR